MSNSIVQVPHASDLYWQCVDLRSAILRVPLGLVFHEDELAAESDSIHLAKLDGSTVIGCLVLKPLSDKVIKMRQVAIDPQYQGKSHGSQLVIACEDIARDLGYTTMVLHARDVAVNFYDRLDYTIEGAQFEEVGIPHYKMVKSLDAVGAIDK